MIKLIIDSCKHSKTYIFHQGTVVIGSGVGTLVDLILPEEMLEPIHVKIMKKDQGFIVVNEANDPFVTLNGAPFGKKSIRDNDILKVGSTKIVFLDEPGIDSARMVDTAVELPAILDRIITSKKPSQPFQSLAQKPGAEPNIQFERSLFEEESFDLEQEMRLLDLWLQEAQDRPSAQETFIEKEMPGLSNTPISVDLSTQEMGPPSTPLQDVGCLGKAEGAEEDVSHSSSTELFGSSVWNKPLGAVPPLKQTIKDLYFKDVEDEEPDKKQPYSSTENGKAVESIDWHTIWLAAVGIIAALLVVALLLYAKANGRSEEEELRAAESVADVSMALAYAQFKNIVPQNQNWSDPEFIRKNLTAILASDYPPLAQHDSHGQCMNCPYLLRIYTSSDLSDFLVIAQPAPSLFQWLIPKSAIVVYSKGMELRKTSDLRSLNRILVNPSLDGAAASEIESIVKKGELISLASRTKRQHSLSFTPPKALGLMRPGAENYIYNAPRYYHFGESIMKKAVTLAENQENNNEILLLQRDIEILQSYPNFVMYSSQGMQAAIQAQKALALFEPQAKFLIAYLQFSSSGAVNSSRLLIDDGNSEVAFREAASELQESFALARPIAFSQDLGNSSYKSRSEVAHPLFFQLSALVAKRQQALKPIAQEITSLLETQNQFFVPHFEEKFKNLSDEYLAALGEQQEKLSVGIFLLYHDYSSMPLPEFMHYMKFAGLDTLAKISLQEHIENLDELSDESIATQMQKIRQVESFDQLEEQIVQTNRILNLQSVPDPDKIMSLQNNIQSEILDKLEEFILSPKSMLLKDSYNEDNRNRLVNILKAGWIRDEDEASYYLMEFDMHTGNP